MEIVILACFTKRETEAQSEHEAYRSQDEPSPPVQAPLCSIVPQLGQHLLTQVKPAPLQLPELQAQPTGYPSHGFSSQVPGYLQSRK